MPHLTEDDIESGGDVLNTEDTPQSDDIGQETTDPYFPITLKSVDLWGRSNGFGGAGSKDDEFNYPAGIALARDESEIYVHDSGNKRIKALTKDGVVLRIWPSGGADTCDGGVWMRGLAVGLEGTIYTVQPYEHDVVGWSPEGKVVSRWPLKDAPDWCGIRHSHDLDVDADGNIYVCETVGANIQVFEPNGTFIRSIGSKGTDKGQFRLLPDSVTVVGDRVYVNAYEEVLTFKRNGDFVGYVSEPGNGQWRFMETAATSWNGWMIFAKREEPTAFYAIAPGSMQVTHGLVMKSGLNPGEVTKPYDFVIDSGGRWYVTELETSRVQVFEGKLEVL